MRLTYSTQAEAQAVADRIDTDLEQADPIYAASKQLFRDSGGARGTARWATPYQDLDKDGKPVDTLWHVTVDQRPRKALTEAEVAGFPEWKVIEK